jgi:hypothetical protein
MGRSYHKRRSFKPPGRRGKNCCLCGKPAGADGYCQGCYDELARVEHNSPHEEVS